MALFCTPICFGRSEGICWVPGSEFFVAHENHSINVEKLAASLVKSVQLTVHPFECVEDTDHRLV